MKSDKLLLFLGIFLSILAISGCSSTNVAVTPDKITTKDVLAEANDKGEVFAFSHYEPEIGNNANSTIIVNTNGKQVSLLEYNLVVFDTPQDFTLYENVSYSDVGTPLNVNSKERELDTQPSSEWYVDPVVTNYGEELTRDLLIDAKKEGGRTERITYPFVLKANTTYALVSNNRAGNSEQVVNVQFREREK